MRWTEEEEKTSTKQHFCCLEEAAGSDLLAKPLWRHRRRRMSRRRRKRRKRQSALLLCSSLSTLLSASEYFSLVREPLQVTGGEVVFEVDSAEMEEPCIFCVTPKPSSCHGLKRLSLMSSPHSNLRPDQLAPAAVGVGVVGGKKRCFFACRTGTALQLQEITSMLMMMQGSGERSLSSSDL